MLKLSGPQLQQTGDTIIEVLISIAIVSLVLAGAYASANHNVRAVQDTQEHAQALKLVQSQVEFLRAAGTAPGSGLCYAADGSAATVSAQCKLHGDGSVNSNGGQPEYDLAITTGAGNCNADANSVQATWDNLFGTRDSVVICYRPVSGA